MPPASRTPTTTSPADADSRRILSIMSLISAWLGAAASRSTASRSSSSRSSSAPLLLPTLLRLPTLPMLLERGFEAALFSTERCFLPRLAVAPTAEGRSCEDEAVGRSSDPALLPLLLVGAAAATAAALFFVGVGEIPLALLSLAGPSLSPPPALFALRREEEVVLVLLLVLVLARRASLRVEEDVVALRAVFVLLLLPTRLVRC